MIRYATALDGLEEAVEAKAKGWGKKARARTAIFRELGGYAEEWVDPTGKTRTLSPFWGDVKPVFMERQHNKCIYCEKRLEGKNFATVEWDLEHFRPKGNVRAWPPAARKLTYDFPTGDAGAGYFLLAYHLHNYAAACKTCNSPLKSDYFPTAAAARISGRENPTDYAGEEAFLAYPLGVLDEDPEDLITFHGVKAEPRHEQMTDSRKHRRGRIMIDFFALNRDGLMGDRAWWLLYTVWPNVELAESGSAKGKSNLQKILSEAAPFTACARQFVHLCRTDRASAEALLAEFEVIVETMQR